VEARILGILIAQLTPSRFSRSRRVAAHFGKDPREYSISTKEFVSDGNGKIKGINTVRVAWEKDALGQWRMSEVPGSEQFFPADLYVLTLQLDYNLRLPP
jgi:NADPH-dependent glutamate synthase beta subunit-like oxidoreductase